MEGGPILNGAFLRENLFDELVLYISPIIGGKEDNNLYENGVVKTLSLENTFINKDGTLLLRYKFKNWFYWNDLKIGI